ncbi:MAG: hypothetical protein HYY30_13445 [Chloroflexi bacterium]|nr:hypothetical protein [Chloroflexota bacterium]
MSLLRESFLEIFYLSTLCRKTKEFLTAYLAGDGKLPGEGVDYLATFTLSHIDDMQQGFKWTLRATEAELDELRYLLKQSDVIEWDGGDEVEKLRPRKAVAPDLRKIQALQHAKVVLSIMPAMPRSAITYPLNRSYADIPPPSRPAELAARIDELERMIWETAMQRALKRLDRNSYRRAYGFFDAANWLAVEHLKLFAKGRSSGADDSGDQLPN